jgi:lysophospholipase L1-like esterase
MDRARDSSLMRIMNENHVRMIDLAGFTASLGTGKDIFSDGVHFNESTQRAQAALIAGWLARHVM